MSECIRARSDECWVKTRYAVRFTIRETSFCFLGLALAFLIWRHYPPIGILLCIAIGGVFGAIIRLRRGAARWTSIVVFSGLGSAVASALIWPVEFASDWPRIAAMPGDRQVAFWAPFFVLSTLERFIMGFGLGMLLGVAIACFLAFGRVLRHTCALMTNCALRVERRLLRRPLPPGQQGPE